VICVRLRLPARRSALAVLILAVSFAATACGSSSRSPLASVQSGAAKTLATTGVWYLVWSSDAVFGPTQRPVGERGASVFSSNEAFGALDLDGLPDGKGGTAFLLFLPRSLYVSLAPTSSLSLPKGKSLVGATLDERTDAAFPGFVEQTEALNPQLLVDELAWGTTSATDRGKQVINHVPFTRYTASVDLDQAAKKAKGPVRIAIDAEIGALGGHGHHVIPVTVWLDGPGHLARVQAPVPGSGFGRVLASIDGFGQAVGSAHPTAKQTVSLAQLASSLPAGRSPFVAFTVSS